MTSILTKSSVENMLDALGRNIEAQMKLMQNSTEATLTETFKAAAQKGRDGMDMADSLAHILRVDLEKADRDVHELELIVGAADALGYNSGTLKKVLPLVKETSGHVIDNRLSHEDTIRYVRDYMNKKGL